MKCPACNAEPLRLSAVAEGLSYCPNCSNFFFTGERMGLSVPAILRALVEVSGFPDVLDGERAAHIAVRILGRDAPMADALLVLGAAGFGMRGLLSRGDIASPERRVEAVAEEAVRRTGLPAGTAQYLAESYAFAIGLLESEPIIRPQEG